MKIVVIGSINMDYSLKVAHLPQKGETLKATSFHMNAGGKGANQAVAARRLGAEVAMIGAVGKDEAGSELLQRLRLEGIDTTGIAVTESRTGMAQIIVEEAGDNSIVIVPGANAEVSESWVKQHEHVIQEADFILVQLEIPLETVDYVIKLANRYHKRVLLNPAPASPLPDKIYAHIDILTPNETELQTLTGCSDRIEGVQQLLDKGVKRVIVTLGEQGCFYMDASSQLRVKAMQVQAIETTGAGDAFNGALAVALCEGKPLEEVLKFSNIVGALVASRVGAQEAMPFRQEVDVEVSAW
ncbi:ribokinase [Paenibacillus pectinilyticus]|uniref:Ribokinase n=1 Tax=Paenibacillus pectinilyticus TaxID=512399 RepID=A0A1C1A2H2_9BACL|nr:ribokinase [Paenibacillus pectinilyticus]OCT14734.1 ribokinase [Paenibacillus pectinilyticus]